MRHEFNNRIEAQRSILKVLNSARRDREELAGLSSMAIDRWVSVNRVEPDAKLVELLRAASAKLFFLANKSQEQISSEYRAVTDELATLCDSIQREAGPLLGR